MKIKVLANAGAVAREGAAIAELLLENRLLKKSTIGAGEDGALK
jgi:hypothetical protein